MAPAISFIRIVPWLPACFLAACSTQPAAPVDATSGRGEGEAKAQVAAPAGVVTGLHGHRRVPAPVAAKAINASAECAFKDEAGVRGRLTLQVEDGSVRRFAAEVAIPRRGACSFDLKDFRQTTLLPPTTLAARDNRCRVHLWEQGAQLTVAFSDCRAYCTGEAFDYLWPILADTRTGECS
jgi:hypothetical protein